MDARRKSRVQTERPKVRRVYVSLVNPDDNTDREHFTAYDVTVKELADRLIGNRSHEAPPNAPAPAATP